MKTIKMVVLAILAMVFTAVAVPAMAADQTKQAQQTGYQVQKKKIRLGLRPVAPPPGMDKMVVMCGYNQYAEGSCKKGTIKQHN